jgi:hypothetical protein
MRFNRASRGSAYVCVDQDGAPALHDACERGHVEVAELLLSNGAQINATNPAGQTGLMWAAIGGRAKMLEMLLAKGADASLKNAAGKDSMRMPSWGVMLTLLLSQVNRLWMWPPITESRIASACLAPFSRLRVDLKIGFSEPAGFRGFRGLFTTTLPWERLV